MFKILAFVLISFSGLCFSAIENPVGVVSSVKGKVFKLVPTTGIKRKKVMLKHGMGVLEGDIIATEKDGFVELEMADETTLSLSSSSSFVIKKFNYIPGIKRITHYHQSWGALRAKIKNPTKKYESVQFNTKHVTVGMKDSEFLSNSYSINNKPTNDLLLLKGKVDINVEQLNLKTKRIVLSEGLLFNSNLIKEKGFSRFPRISGKFLNLLSNTRDFFLPRAQASNGKFIDINKILGLKSLQKKILNNKIIDQVTPKLSGKSAYRSRKN